MKKVHITTLGCSKNIVDSEVLMGQLEDKQFRIKENPEDADVLIINTCGFIEEAKDESIQAIFEALKLKEDYPPKKVFIAGCLSQRYRREIEKEIPEVDEIFGTEDYINILKALGKKHTAPDNLHRMRKLTTPGHYAYLKISEGCDHKCAFCAIPSIRGKHRSRSIESLVDEAKKLSDKGTKELILISQDTSYYGKDLYSKQRIVDLLEALLQVEGLEWIRVMYWYPTNFPVEVLDLMKSSDKLVSCIDMPIQHISNRMLRLMRRGDSRTSIVALFEKIRAEIPDVTLRTTLILGHPGEKDEDFRELLKFVKEIKFDRLGTFRYSDEDGTRAFTLGDKVHRDVALQRQELIMEAQRGISLMTNSLLIGKRMKVLLDEFLINDSTFVGRTYRDAPEIDNEVLISIKNVKCVQKPGDFVMVEIEDASEYELYGKFN